LADCPKLTLNLGARYDLSINANGNNYAVPPFVDKGRPADKNNIQPRAGFAYRLTPNTVVRGGTGVYFSTPLQIDTFFMAQIDRLVVVQYTNDGRPDFGSNPTTVSRCRRYHRGSSSSVTSATCRGVCGVRSRSSLRQPITPHNSAVPGRTPSASSIRLAATMAVEADYVYSQGRNEKDVISNMNLTFNPATGANYPFSDISRRAYPDFGAISMVVRMGRSRYHALQTAVTKRFSNHWQGGATYTLSGLWDAYPQAFSGITPVPSRPHPILGASGRSPRVICGTGRCSMGSGKSAAASS
jgi:hypothetical protein